MNIIQKRRAGQNAWTFDGVTDHLLRGGDLTGAVDSKLFTLSGWVKPHADQMGVFAHIMQTSGAAFRFNYATANKLSIIAENAAGTQILNTSTSNSSLSAGVWAHVMCSVNTATSTVQVYLNGSSDANTTVITANEICNFTPGEWAIGANTGGTNNYKGEIGPIFLKMGTALDLSIAANRARLYSANGMPPMLGSHGERVTGSRPELYFNNRDLQNGFNRGGGGSFTLTGSLGLERGPLRR